MKNRSLPAAGAALILTLAGFGLAGPAAGSANTNEGPYDNDCVASDNCAPSMNGNGMGKAVGRPDAGSVGNADKKNPKGQLPDADDDGNNGYECDGNSGITKGNPAHSGCAAEVPT
jgi:hypothetical protein